MATAATLPQAAGQSFDNLFALWVAGGNTLRSALAAFAAALLPTFPDQDQVARPIADWLTIIAATAQQMPSLTAPSKVDYTLLFVPANDYVYRICWLAAKPSVNSPDITTAQQTAVLAAYNANF